MQHSLHASYACKSGLKKIPSGYVLEKPSWSNILLTMQYYILFYFYYKYYLLLAGFSLIHPLYVHITDAHRIAFIIFWCVREFHESKLSIHFVSIQFAYIKWRYLVSSFSIPGTYFRNWRIMRQNSCIRIWYCRYYSNSNLVLFEFKFDIVGILFEFDIVRIQIFDAYWILNLMFDNIEFDIVDMVLAEKPPEH